MSNLCWALEKKLFYCLSFFVLLFSLCGKLEKPSNNFLPVFLLLFIYLSIVIFHCFFVFVFFVHLSFDSRGISKLSLKKVVLAVETIRLNNLFLLSRRFCKTLKKKKQYVLFLNYYFGSNQWQKPVATFCHPILFIFIIIIIHFPSIYLTLSLHIWNLSQNFSHGLLKRLNK